MRTTVFRNGGSQAIRIPAQFRFEGDSVDVEWDESMNALVVRPQPANPWARFFALQDEQPEFELPAELPMTDDGRLDVAAFMDLGEVAA
jgi:antitoxin VapB